MIVAPQAQVAVGNAGFGGDAGGLEDDEAEAAQGEATKMDEMPVVGEAVARRILAHGGHDRAVTQGQLAQFQRRKQKGHQGTAGVG